ncbi:MAG: hypothetical protein U0325_33800 [Polyangiales bacterium]
MSVVESGELEDVLTVPSDAESLAHNRRGALCPRQIERLRAYHARLGVIAATGLSLGGPRGLPTRADLDDDLAAGGVAAVDGEFVWVRGNDGGTYAGVWQLVTSDGARYPLNGGALPGPGRGYVLPRYRMVVGAEPAPDPARALAAYRETLMRALGTRDADRAANEGGAVGPGQRAMVRAGSWGPLGAILGFIGLLLGFTAIAGPSIAQPGAGLATSKGQLVVGALALAALLPAGWILSRAYLLAPKGRVRCVDGVLSRRVGTSRRYDLGEGMLDTAFNRAAATEVPRLFLNVNGELFDAQHLAQMRVSSAIVLGLPHRVWFEETTRAIVAIDVLGV